MIKLFLPVTEFSYSILLSVLNGLGLQSTLVPDMQTKQKAPFAERFVHLLAYSKPAHTAQFDTWFNVLFNLIQISPREWQ